MMNVKEFWTVQNNFSTSYGTDRYVLHIFNNLFVAIENKKGVFYRFKIIFPFI